MGLTACARGPGGRAVAGVRGPWAHLPAWLHLAVGHLVTGAPQARSVRREPGLPLGR